MISIIIPTYNEAEYIGGLIKYLQKNSGSAAVEIIVSDAGSTDDTMNIVRNVGAIAVSSPRKGRAAQMNFGASVAQGNVFYFVHADCLPPKSFMTDILEAIHHHTEAGRYKTRFNSKSRLLKLNAFFTRFDWFVCYGGDQTLFITRTLFENIKGYDETKLIMEDYDITTRIKNTGSYKILEGYALVSARKYEKHSWPLVQSANYKAIKMYKAGAASREIAETYQKKLKG
ncbi:MAG: TIGR04283 family arsenosugar biosynthesis glycosyltransferase [Gloeobacteraceae cyanobacterium ES-bin-316]|nr:TIGR04283 family arsenosugar biosynthesis glycosyltransferase [Ferruginibacter sp.]